MLTDAGLTDTGLTDSESTPDDSPFWPVVILGAVTIGFGQLGYTTLLPALLDIEKEFGVSDHSGAMVITSFIVGMAISTLVIGVFASSFRESNLLCLGFILFSLAGFSGVFSSSFDALLFSRFGAGVGAGFLAFLVRMVYRAKFRGARLSLAFSWYAIFFAGFPLLGPYMGSFILHHWSWRAIFYFLGGIGASGALCIWLARGWFCSGCERPWTIRGTCEEWKTVLSNRDFLTYMIIYISGYVVYQLMLVSTPYVLMKPYHLSPIAYGGLMILLGVGDICGSLASIALVKLWSQYVSLTTGIIIGFISVLPFLWEGAYSMVWVTVFLFVLFVGNSIVLANSLSIALDKVSVVSPAASSLIGTGQMSSSALVMKGIALTVGLSLTVVSFVGVLSSAAMLLLRMRKRQ